MKVAPILSLSWKNIWRNKARSLVVIVAVILGTGAGVFMSAFMYGMSMQMVQSEIENHTSKFILKIIKMRYCQVILSLMQIVL